MNISYSELILLNNDVLENVDRLIGMGASHIELMLDGASWDRHYGNLSDLARRLRRKDVSYSLHPTAWDTNLTAEMKFLRETAYDHHLHALKFAAEVGARQMVLHPGFVGSPCFSKTVAQQRSREATQSLAEVAKTLGVRLALENVGYKGQSIFNEEEFVSALDGIDETVGFLIDLGHAHLNHWNIPRLIDSVSDRLIAFHIHDNNGQGDQHLPIFDGTIPWAETFTAMKRNHNLNCEYILEYAPGFSLETLTKGKEVLVEKLS